MLHRHLAYYLFSILAASSLALAACTPLPPGAAPGATALPASETPATPVTLTSIVTSTPAATAPASAETHSAPPEQVSPAISLEQNNTTLVLQVGGRFLLKLGETDRWNITIDHPEVVSRVQNITVVKGAQGVYEATQAGKAILNAAGTQVCDPSQGACSHLVILFTLNIIVSK